MNRKYYILSFLLLWCTSLLLADDIKFTASVNKTQVGAGEVFEVTFSVNGNGNRFTPPPFNGFQIVSGPNVSTSMTSINGNMTMSNAYSYDLVAPQVGTYTITPATMVVNGKTVSTNPIKITVVKGQPAQRNSRSQSMQGDEDDTAPQANSNVDISKLLFIKAVVNKTHVYQGEPITLSYRIYRKVDILDDEGDKLPELNGFWGQDVNTQQQQNPWKISSLNGERFYTADVKQSILFPEHAGNLIIDPMEMTFVARVPAPSQDVMDQFFGGSFTDKKVKVKSQPVTIHVDPLPDAGKPEGFGGAVGTFTISASIDKNSIKANEAINYTVKVSGRGNIKLLQPLNAVFPTDFEKYDPKTTDTITTTAEGVSGSRIYNYLLIPRHQGSYTIDPIKFSYFNPATRKYVTLTTKSFNVEVAKGANESNLTVSAVDKQDVKLLDKDIRYIKTGAADLNEKGDAFFGSVWYYLLLLLGPLAAIAAFIYRKWYEQQNSDIVKVKSRQASKVAAKHLANAQKQLTANNSTAFYEDLFKGLYGYLSNKLNIPYANLDKETIAAALKSRSVSDGLTKQLQDTLDLCDMARFAPVTGISKQEVFDKAKNIINSIEDEI